MVIPQGIHRGLSADAYHGWKLDRSRLIDGPISCSMLKAFAPNPYAWARTPDAQPTKAMRTGSLFDAVLTDPQWRDRIALMEFENFRTKAAQEWRDEQDAAGRLIVREDELEHAMNAAEAVRAHHVAGEILDGCEFQVGVVGSIGSIPAKCLIDIVPSEGGDWAETLVDYKTTSNGLDDEAIRKTLGDRKYHWQAAFYRTLWNKTATDRHCEDFAFVFQDVATLEVRVVKLAPDALALGTRAVKAAAEEFVRCAHRGIGSRYARTADELDLMPYHAMNEDEALNALEEVAP